MYYRMYDQNIAFIHFVFLFHYYYYYYYYYILLMTSEHAALLVNKVLFKYG
jgi:hypothetical protein